ncbi:MAG: hypothetical protein Q9177_005740, partial [Variospora cf. flavescens]
MKPLILPYVIGAAALVIHGVAGAALPVDYIKRHESADTSGQSCFKNTEGQLLCPPTWERVEPRDIPTGKCWTTMDGEKHCPSTHSRRGACWEASNGQVQCSDDDTSDINADSTTVTAAPAASTMTSPAEISDEVASDDDSADGSGTTCVHTTEGFLQCGDVMRKRDEDSVAPSMSPFLSSDDTTTTDEDLTAETGTTCVHTADGFVQCGDPMAKREAIDPDHLPTHKPFPKDWCFEGFNWKPLDPEPKYCWELGTPNYDKGLIEACYEKTTPCMQKKSTGVHPAP